jgi:protocatechuate 3,4-dioxygenase beta subunit
MKKHTLALLAIVLFVAPLAAQTPNHREGAPFRAKLSPPHAEGQVLVVKGRVTDTSSGKGVAHAVLDAFQADAEGHYDTDGFEYRARVLTDEEGRFEFETIVPSNYGPAPHIHFFVMADGYRERRTDMYFRDEEHPEGGGPELTPKLIERKADNGKGYVEARFDVTLEPVVGSTRPAASR